MERTSMVVRSRGWLIAGAAALTGASAVAAQAPTPPLGTETPPSRSPDQGRAQADDRAQTRDDTANQGEIVVTALKQRSTLLRTPAAITVLSGADLKTQGVNTLNDVQNLAPNVDIATGRDGVQVAIRGVTTADTSAKGEQDIAFNIDGVYVGRGNARGSAFFDVDRIEVLRGPQGTVYGRSATGGAINVVTNRPKLDELSGYAKAEYGNYDAKRFEGAVNLPLGDMFAIRLAGAVTDRDGNSKPIDNDPTFNGVTYHYPAGTAKARNDQKDQTGRFSLLFSPNPDFTLRLTATVGHQGGVGAAPALETQLEAHGDGGSGLKVLANPVPAFQDSRFRNFDANLNWKLGSVQLDLLGSYQYLQFRQQNPSVQDVAANGGGTISPVFLLPTTLTFGPAFQFYLQQNRARTTQFEGRLSNADPERIEFVFGANYFRERVNENGQSWNALVPDPLDQQSYVFQSGPVNTTTHEAYGLFGQATWHITDRLSLLGGARFTHDAVDRDGRFALPFDFAAGFPPPPYPDANGNPICHYPDTCVGDPNNGHASDSKVTWKAGLNYQVTPDHLLYASVATGFKGGGFNDYDPAVNGIGQYKPSSITAYEVGYKGRPLPGLTLTSDFFYYDFSRDQITSAVIFAGNNTIIFTQTVPARVYGWENEFNYRVARQTFVSGSLSLLHSRFVNYQSGQYAYQGDPVDFSGRALDLSPKFSVTGAVNQSFDLGDNKLRFRGAIKYSASYFISDFADAVRYRQPSFTRSDASLTYELHNARYAIQLFVENIENKVQRTSLLGYANSGAPYGGVGGYTPAATAANPSPLPVPGDTHVGVLPDNNLAFYTTTPRFFGIRGTINF